MRQTVGPGAQQVTPELPPAGAAPLPEWVSGEAADQGNVREPLHNGVSEAIADGAHRRQDRQRTQLRARGPDTHSGDQIGAQHREQGQVSCADERGEHPESEEARDDDHAWAQRSASIGARMNGRSRTT